MRRTFLLLVCILTTCITQAQMRDRTKMQYDVHVGDTIYKYSLLSKIQWEGFIVVSKDENNLITAVSFDGNETIQPYQRREGSDYGPLNERVYVGKQELIRHLSIVPEFILKMTKVKRKRGNSVLDLTKNAKLNLCKFSDNAIEAQWSWGDNEYFGLSLRNKSEIDPISVIWDDAIYVDMDGNSGPIVNSSNRSTNNHQEPSRILEGTKISVALIPVSCITSSGSQITYGIALDRYKSTNSNNVRICLPIKIKGVVSRYDFYFLIDSISELEYLRRNGLIDI